MSELLQNKTVVLGVAGVLAFSAAYWFNKPADSDLAIVQPTIQGAKNRAPSPIRTSADAATSNIETPERGVISSQNLKDIFSPRSWLPPPPPPPPPAPPAPPLPAPPPAVPVPAPPPVIPVAPPVPFTFVGALEEKGSTFRVFLSKGDQLLVAKVNDVLEGRYRIEQITESAVTLTYLPLNQKQIMTIQPGGI